MPDYGFDGFIGGMESLFRTFAEDVIPKMAG